MADPAFAFTLDCDSRHYYLVQIYRTQADAASAIAELRGRKDPSDRDVRACCLRYVAVARHPFTQRKRQIGELGTLIFVAGDMGNGVVVHELTHAAVYWARRRKLKPMSSSKRGYNDCAEEKFAHVLQHLVEQFDSQCPNILRVSLPVAA